MKKIIYLFAALTLIMSAASCNNDKKQAEIDQKQEQIDNLNRFIDIVGVYMDSINTQEQNLFVGKDGMKLSRKEEILANLRAYKSTVEDQRARIAELEEQLANKNDEQSAKLRAVIASLKHQLAEKDAKIASLEKQLAQKDVDIAQLNEEVSTLNTRVGKLNTHVSDLNQHVSSLNDQVEELDEENQQKEQTIHEQQQKVKELTTGYVKIATKDQLAALGIIKAGSGLFAKKKFDANGVDNSLFQKVSTTQTQTFNIPGKKAEIMTQHPAGSYRLSGQTLTITNPTRFWSVSHYLVVKYK